MVAKTPPLGSVRAFESAARHLNFTRAATELGITQAAVSWQIRALEQRLGVSLFERGRQGLTLTAAGRALAPNVTDALERLATAFEAITPSASAAKCLRISSVPTFAHSWLVPRLGGFRGAHPDLMIEIDATTKLADLEGGAADVAIRSGKGNWPGLVSHRLLPVILAPMCAPRLIAGRRKPLRVGTIAEFPLLQPLSLWRRWLAGLGLPDQPFAGKVTASYRRQHMVLQATLAGQGMALLNSLFCEDALNDGRLVRAVPDTVTSGDDGYWFVYRKNRQRTPRVEAFRTWIVGESAAALAQLSSQRKALRLGRKK